jgi:uncharacterized protein
MKKFKLAAAVILFILTAAILPIGVFANDVPKPADIFYVLDMSGVLKDDTINYIVEKNDLLYYETGAQIVVVTTDFVRNGDLEQYAYNLFNDWGIGSKQKNNGILLVLSIGDDDYFCMQGRGLENTLTSGTIGNMLEEYLEPDFAKQDYDAGVRKIFDALYSRVSALYRYKDGNYNSVIGEVPITGPQNNNTSSGGRIYNISPIVVLVIIFIVLSFIRSAGRSSDGCLGCLFGWLLLGGSRRGPRGFGPRGFGGSRGGGGGSTRGGGAGRR